MKKSIRNILIVTAIGLFVNPIYAEYGNTHDNDELYMKNMRKYSTVSYHDKELPKRKIQRAAKVKLWDLVQKKKIPAFWMDTPIVATDKRKFEIEVEWVVQFKDKNTKDKKKEIIYVFVDFYGKVTGVNYTGH